MRFRPAARLVVVLLAAGCSGRPAGAPALPPGTVRSPGAGSAAAASPSPGVSPAATSGPGAAAAFTDWPVYHQNPAHTGVDPAPTAIPGAAPARAWASEALDANNQGEPLVVGGRVIAATENNTVYAFSASGGRQLWSTHLGAPEQASALPCGDISPVSGITSTPAADPATQMVYVLAFLRSGRHLLYALDTSTGRVAWSREADAPGLDPLTEQQRAGLVVANGMVYIAYGGLYGDCGTYHGAIVAIPESGAGAATSYVVPSGNAAGIWGPSALAVDSSGDIFVTTGNSDSSTRFDDANAVIKLSPTLQPVSFFAPGDWARLNRGDLDLGTEGPVLLQSGDVFQVGKTGTAYVASAANLGGVGGQIASARICDAAYGGTAYQAGTVYVACTSGLVAVSVTPAGAMHVIWKDGGFSAGPPILAQGRLWALDLSSNHLLELNASSGAVLHAIATPALPHFASPAATGSLIVVAGARSIEAFRA